MFTNDYKHLDNPIYQPFDAIFLSVNVVFDSNYWPYSQILISCLPTNCGMSLKLKSLVPNYSSDITYVENAGRVITAGFHTTAKMSL